MNDGRSWSLIGSMALLDGTRHKIINADRNLITFFFSLSLPLWASFLVVYCCWFVIDGNSGNGGSNNSTKTIHDDSSNTKTNNAAFCVIISFLHLKWISYELSWVIQHTRTRTRNTARSTERNKKQEKNGIAHSNQKKSSKKKKRSEEFLSECVCVCVWARLLFASCKCTHSNTIFTFLWNNLT